MKLLLNLQHLLKGMPWFGLVLAVVSAALASGCGGASPQQQAASPSEAQPYAPQRVRLGAEVLLETRLDELRGKRVALVAHAASMVYDTMHIADALITNGIRPRVVFAPEHGFRGQAEAGATVRSGVDSASGLRVFSLYGDTKRPPASEMDSLDVVVFDIQDVGARFYTYLSTLAYVMEACAYHHVKLLVLDRPNPNGFYVGGPVMRALHTSFVGLHAGVPIVHGMTLGEYARMLNREGWLAGQLTCPLEVVRLEGWTHATRWAQTGLRWHPPSPNLQTPLSAELYPALCMLEGTVASLGRGTDWPFEVAGFPQHTAVRRRLTTDSLAGETTQPTHLVGIKAQPIAFTPRAWPGRAENPPLKGQLCYGLHFITPPDSGQQAMRFAVELLQHLHNEYVEYYKMQGVVPPTSFFTNFFEKLAGNDELRVQIKQGVPSAQVVAGWEREAAKFRATRLRNLLYPER